VLAVVVNPPELPNYEARTDGHAVQQAQVCGCISAHPGLPHQQTKRETCDASKSELNQSS